MNNVKFTRCSVFDKGIIAEQLVCRRMQYLESIDGSVFSCFCGMEYATDPFCSYQVASEVIDIEEE